MTLNTTYNPTVAEGNGVTTQFSYSFNPLSINYLKVSLEISGAWVQQTSGWTATVSENGGIVTFDTAPTTRVAIERDVPEEQPTSYETSSGFQAKVIEHSFDMLTSMVQELNEKSERSVSVEVGSPINPEQVVQQIERVYTSIDNVDVVADDLANVNSVAVDLTNVDIVAGSITNVNKVGNDINKVNTVAGSIVKVETVADNISNVNAVYGDITKVNAVADDLTNIDKVANNETNINKVANIDSDVSVVAGIKNDVSTVSGISGNVTAVANNLTNVTTVATNISNVNKVGNAISNVNKVGNSIVDVNNVADDLTNIDTVAGSISNVSAVGGNISNVNAVANNETNINTVVSNLTDVTNVASYIGNIVTVSSGINEVQAVASDLSNIDGVSQYLGQIETVSDNITNVNAVGSNISNVNTVASNISDVNTVAGDHANIQTVVNNMTAINNAPTYASNANVWAEGTDAQVQALGGVHSSKGWAEVSSSGQIQADWEEDDPTSKAYINNKPTIPSDGDLLHTTGNETKAGTMTFSSSPIVPTPATSDDSTKAANTAFVKAQGYALDGNVVKLSGNQSIAGNKTFIGYAISQNAWQVSRTDFTKGDIPSSTRYFGLFSLEALPQDSSSTAWQDKRLGVVEVNVDTSGNTTLMFGAYRNKTNADGGGNNFQIRIKKLANNTGYAELSESPASGDSSTKIATTAFVKSVLSTSGNGLATFSQGESGYYKFTNGLMFQWGKISAASGDAKTVTFPQPFTSANYFATCCINRSGKTESGYQYCTSKTTTGCEFTCGTTETFWMALGY